MCQTLGNRPEKPQKESTNKFFLAHSFFFFNKHDFQKKHVFFFLLEHVFKAHRLVSLRCAPLRCGGADTIERPEAAVQSEIFFHPFL